MSVQIIQKSKINPEKLRRIAVVILLLFGFVFLKAEDTKNPEIEIGIVEHLSDTLPLETWLLNENNDTVILGDLIDKPTVLNFVYFDCPGVCSPLMAAVSDVVSKLDLELGTDYQVMTISFNTKDSPEKARIKKENFVSKISKENQQHWMYLTGNQENIDALTNATGFRYKIRGNDFDHIGALILLSPSGKITRYLYGAGQSGYGGSEKGDGMRFLPFDVKLAIIEAQKEQARPTSSRLLAFCFAYDSASKTYQLQITRIVASLSIAIALLLFITLSIKGRRKIVKT